MIADAVTALKKDHSNLRVVSIGVGVYPEPSRYWHRSLIHNFFLVRPTEDARHKHASMETLARLLFKDVPLVRINDEYSALDMATDLIEHDMNKLRLLYHRAWESYARHEDELKTLLGGRG